MRTGIRATHPRQPAEGFLSKVAAPDASARSPGRVAPRLPAGGLWPERATGWRGSPRPAAATGPRPSRVREAAEEKGIALPRAISRGATQPLPFRGLCPDTRVPTVALPNWPPPGLVTGDRKT